MTKRKLPSGYTPYDSLEICSNTLSGGGVPFEFGRVTPILVGRGDVPKVWLTVPTDRRGKKQGMELARENHALIDRIQVFPSESDLTVRLDNQTVLELIVLSVKSAKIPFIDLRPLGINVFGDRKGLTVGGNQLVGNTFSGVGVMVKLA